MVEVEVVAEVAVGQEGGGEGSVAHQEMSKRTTHDYITVGEKVGPVTLEVEAECNQTPARLQFGKSPEKRPKPTSLAGGFSKCRYPNGPLGKVSTTYN